jgi:hypothetical protein
VNRLYEETAKRRGPTRAVEPFKKKIHYWKSVQLVSTNLKMAMPDFLKISRY